MFIRRKREKKKDDHADVQEQLDKQRRQLLDYQRRLRAVELEVGIYKPPVLKEVNGQ